HLLISTCHAVHLPACVLIDQVMLWYKLAKVDIKVGGCSRPVLFLPAFDHHVQLIADHREDLEGLGFRIPQLTAAQLATAATKERFYALCDDLGVPYPPSQRFSGARAAGASSLEEHLRDVVDLVEQDTELSYPLIVKADEGGTW